MYTSTPSSVESKCTGNDNFSVNNDKQCAIKECPLPSAWQQWPWQNHWMSMSLLPWCHFSAELCALMILPLNSESPWSGKCKCSGILHSSELDSTTHGGPGGYPSRIQGYKPQSFFGWHLFCVCMHLGTVSVCLPAHRPRLRYELQSLRLWPTHRSASPGRVPRGKRPRVPGWPAEDFGNHSMQLLVKEGSQFINFLPGRPTVIN